jgi:hypothetical protein
MSETNWKWRLICYLPVTMTDEQKNMVASVFATYGSHESQANELNMFDNARRMSTNGSEPATQLRLSSLVNNDLRTQLASLPVQIVGSVWYMIACVRRVDEVDPEIVYEPDTLILSSNPSANVMATQAFTTANADSYQGIQAIVESL